MPAYITHPMGELKSILLAADGSSCSSGAIKEAIHLARACGTKLTVLRVHEFRAEYDPEAHRLADVEHMRKLEEETQEYFAKIKDAAAEENVECVGIIRKSKRAHEAIVEVARERHSDVIIMGKHGRTGLQRLLMGSVTAKAVAYAPCKILVVPQDVQLTGENILLATDGSDFSELAEDEALNMRQRCAFARQLVAVSIAAHKDKLEESEQILERVRNKARQRNIEIETLALVGEPYKTIINASLETGADVIVMGTHGRTGLARLLIGSVAERVVALSACPVLVAKPCTVAL